MNKTNVVCQKDVLYFINYNKNLFLQLLFFNRFHFKYMIIYVKTGGMQSRHVHNMQGMYTYLHNLFHKKTFRQFPMNLVSIYTNYFCYKCFEKNYKKILNVLTFSAQRISIGKCNSSKCFVLIRLIGSFKKDSDHIRFTLFS